MELMFAERLRKYRRERDLTQEELAQEIGISPQSVSKWERGDGYPDITLLPKIANYFGISIDFLLGNDKATRDEDIEHFFRLIREELPNDDMDARLRLGKEYAEKYPENDAIAHELCWIINWSDKEVRDENLPLLREQCEKLIRISTVQTYRESAIALMCKLGTDEDYEKWAEMCAHHYSAYRGEVLEERLLEKERYEECALRKGANKLELFCHLMQSNCGNWGDPVKTMAWSRYRLRLMESFGENGELPSAWQGWYAVNLVYIADNLFLLEKNGDGYRHLEDAYKMLVRWSAIPNGTALEVGHDWLFHGIKVLKDQWNFLFPDGTEEYSNHMGAFCDHRDFLYRAMTMGQNWHGFDRVRDEEHFRELLERARILAETPAEASAANR